MAIGWWRSSWGWKVWDCPCLAKRSSYSLPLCRDRAQLQRWGGDCGRRIRRDRWRQRRLLARAEIRLRPERIGMSEARIKLGQYLFLKHGAKVVFLGRFVALLRMLAAFLAGVNRMPWHTFLIANAGGGIIWAAVFGIGGYFFGKLLLQLHHALAPIVFALALAAFFGCGYLVRRYEDRLTASAERALPDPLVAAVDKKRP